MRDTEAGEFSHEIRVGWGHCDPARIAYTGHIPGWALEAIDAWWEAHLDGDGWFEMEIDRGYGTPFVHLSMDFLSPITPRHRLVCAVWPVRLGETSISFRVIGSQDGQRCFSGLFVSVFMRAGAFRAVPAPDEARALVEALIRPDIPDARG
ncbi:acyl-CoA thioesterase [Marinibacterium sp. SX1]|uniref:acyl-CoA thioesterase n=1 Tax=Marinibacterium sp. SX1 TaxID=3388424 RepID=UPI003D186DCE